MNTQQVHLGFEVGTGDPVAIPLRHLAVTGQTQESGKTTTLEALISRANVPAIAFVTKRGEGSFARSNRIPPYFRDRADWQFVDQLLEAQLREKNKFLRPWIIKLCRQTKTLADVQREVRKGLKKAKGISEGVYTQLDAYLDLIVPEIARAPLATGIQLRPGLNVMDVSGYATPMQMLFVQSAIDWVNTHERGTVVIVPEAWEFIPESKGSPVKDSAVSLVRKGAGIQNFIWVDSQDMAGVDKVILRGCPVWLIGVQREANEIKRNLSNIPAGIKKPKAADIALLNKGQFYACWSDRTVKVYVQPAWMTEEDARSVAMNQQSIHDFYAPPSPEHEPQPQPVEDSMSLEKKIDQLIEAFQSGRSPGQIIAVPAAPTVVPSDEEAMYQRFKARLQAEAPALLKVLAQGPELEVTVERQTVEADGNTLRGRVARLLADGWFDEPKTGSAAWAEMGRRGFSTAKPNVYKELDKLAEMGFVTKETSGGYQAVKGMKVNIVRK